MKGFELYQIVILVCIITLSNSESLIAQNSAADSIAKSRSIFVKKEIKNVTVYDYGKTEMDLTFFKYVTLRGNMYFSHLYLKIPDQDVDIYLSLNDSKLFLKKLYGLYQIDLKKDNGHVWRERKNYFFSMNSGINKIYFRLNAAQDGNPEESSASGGINNVRFTINNFQENRGRTRKALEQLLKIVSKKENDLSANLLEDQAGISGYKIDYQKFYDNGIKVFGSDIHNTGNLKIIAKQKISRKPRKIPLSEFKNNFENYTIAYDEQLNFYAVEHISIPSLIEEIVSTVKSYGGTGILDLKISKKGDTIYSTFFIEKGRYEGNDSYGDRNS